MLAVDAPGTPGDPVAYTFWGAMKIIIVADALMGVDNVLGVVGAAHGALELVVIGLLISVLIVVFGSTLVLRLVELGFVPGGAVRIIAEGMPGREPLAVRVGHTTFGLRRHEASFIVVTPADPK